MITIYTSFKKSYLFKVFQTIPEMLSLSEENIQHTLNIDYFSRQKSKIIPIIFYPLPNVKPQHSPWDSGYGGFYSYDLIMLNDTVDLKRRLSL